MHLKFFANLALGFLLALAIPPTVNAAITGQWDFTTGNLSATTGIDLQYLDGAGGETAQQTVFGTTASLGLPNIGGEPAHVMGFPKSLPHMGYLISPNMQPNGGGGFVNQYTLIFDLLFPPDSADKWRALIQVDDPGNSNDAELFINPAGGIGIAGQYQGQVQADTWHRIAFAFDLAHESGPLLRKYIDGVLVGQQILNQGVDGRWALNPAGGFFGETALLFTDDDADGGSVQPGFVSSIQVHDVPLSSAYIAALGAPGTDAIPVSVEVPAGIISRRPAPDSINVAPGSRVEVVIEEGSDPLDTGTIVLEINDNPLSTTISTEGGLISVQADLPLLDARSENTARIRFTDPAAGQISEEWAFRMAPYILDPELEESMVQGLISYWNLNDGLNNPETAAIVDSVGDNHGDLFGGGAHVWRGGINAEFGGALRLDGQQTYAIIPASESLDIKADQVTVSVWVQLEQLPSEMAHSFGGIYDSIPDSYVLYLDRGNRELRFKVTDASNHAARPGIPEADLVLDEWIHVAGVYDGSGSVGEARVYLNGELADVHIGHDGTPGSGLTGLVLPGQVAALGRNGPEATYFFQGSIDDVAVWNRALTVDEIGYLAAGNPVPAPDREREPLIIVGHPQDQTAIEGSTVRLGVRIEGGEPPVTYQWRQDGVDILGATDASLFVSVTPDSAGTYTVIVEDEDASRESDPAVLTVVALPAAASEALSFGLVAHWPFDGDFTSTTTGYHGLPHNGASISTENPPIGSGAALFDQSNNNYVQVRQKVIPDNALSYTIAGWFNVTGGEGRRFPWESYPDNWALSLEITGGDALSFSMMQADTSWQGRNTGIVPNHGQWYHVAVTFDGNPGVLTCYLDGVHVGEIQLKPGMGAHPLDGINFGTFRSANGRFFEGMLDDIGIWTRVLAESEIQHLAAGNAIPQAQPRALDAPEITAQPGDQTAVAGATAWFTAGAEGSGTLLYQWQQDGEDIPGETTPVLRRAGKLQNAGDYTLAAFMMDAAGNITQSATSDAAALTVVAIPAVPVESLPVGLTASWGFDGTFAGSMPGFDGIPFEAVISAEARIGSGAVFFDQGEGSYVQVTGPVLHESTYSYTIAGWFNLAGGLGRRFPWESYPDNWALSLEITGAGALSYSMMLEDRSSHAQNTGYSPQLDQWYHVAVVFDGEPGRLTCYLDGVELGQISTKPLRGAHPVDGINFGTFRNADARFFHGLLDDIGIWERMLTADEIQFLAAGNAIPAEPAEGIQITGITVGDSVVTIQWAGGEGPFQLQRRASLTEGVWEDVGEPTSDTQATDNIAADMMFYRVQGN